MQLVIHRFATYSAILLVIVLLVILPFLLIGETFEEYVLSIFSSPMGTIGSAFFVVSLLAADVLLPIPSSGVAISAGAVLGTTLGTAAIWVGMTIGSWIAYVIGRSGSASYSKLLHETKHKASPYGWKQRMELTSVIICRPVPVLAEVSSIMAGIVRLPLKDYLAVSALSNLAIAMAYAWIGANLRNISSLYWIVAVSIALPVVVWTIYQIARFFLGRKT